jgi:hypothetical protein
VSSWNFAYLKRTTWRAESNVQDWRTDFSKAASVSVFIHPIPTSTANSMAFRQAIAPGRELQ